MKDLGPCGQFTEIKLERNLEKKTISISPKVYIEKALENANMTGLPADNPFQREAFS